MEKKNYKPKNCRQCPAVRLEKGKIKCGCQPKNVATTRLEENLMWKNCPIGWDTDKK